MYADLRIEVEQVRSKIKAELRAHYRKVDKGLGHRKLDHEIFIGDAYMNHVHEHGLFRIIDEEITHAHTWSELETSVLLWSLENFEKGTLV